MMLYVGLDGDPHNVYIRQKQPIYKINSIIYCLPCLANVHSTRSTACCFVAVVAT